MLSIDISSRHTEIDEGTKQYIREKISKLEKYLDMLKNVETVVSKEDNHFEVEVICRIYKQNPIIAKKQSDDIPAAIDKLHDILEVKLSRLKDKVKNRKSRESGRFTVDE